MSVRAASSHNTAEPKYDGGAEGGEVITLSSNNEVEGDEDGGGVIVLSSDDEVEGGKDGDAEGGEVIALSSDDKVEGGGAKGVKVGPEDEEIDVDEWRSSFPQRPRRRYWPGPSSRHTVHDEEGLAQPLL